MPSVMIQRVLTQKTIAQPAAGAECIFTVPATERWLFHGLLAVLVNSATVATRSPSLIIDDGTNTLFHFGPNNGSTAGLAVDWQFGNGVGNGQPGAGGNAMAGVQIPSPETLGVLLPGYRIRTSTLNIQAGDQYGIPRASVYLLD